MVIDCTFLVRMSMFINALYKSNAICFPYTIGTDAIGTVQLVYQVRLHVNCLCGGHLH